MAFTYTTLKTAIQAYVESDEATFITNLPVIIKQAEDRILEKVQLPNFKKTDASATVNGTTTLAIPADFLAPYYLTIDNSGTVPLLFKELGFIREAYPVSTVKGAPKHYAILDDDTFVLGPTPDAAYPTDLYYFYRPTSIVDSGDGTSWLGTNAESALFSACLLEAYIFLKGDENLIATYAARADDAMKDLKTLGEGRLKTDVFRNG